MQRSFFINDFQKGATESSQLGMGNLVGVDTYSKKGVVKLARKITIITTGFSSYPTFFESSQGGNYLWAQCADGSINYSSNGGSSWSTTSFPTAGHGNGMIFFQNFMHAWTDTAIYVWKDNGTISGNDPTNGAWGNGATGGAGTAWQTGQTSFVTDPITSLHFPFLFPNNRGVYYGNGAGVTAGDCTLGFFGQNGTTKYNPGGTAGSDYLYNGAILTLPSYTWTIGPINFLPPSTLAIAVNNWQNPSQGSQIITWDTVSANKFTPPLQIFSDTNATDSGINTAGIKQMFNRNQVLYLITGGNHAIYEYNGSSFNLVEDIALYSSLRQVLGAENDYPVFYNSFPSAVTVMGNRLLTGTAPMTNNSTAGYPPSNTGFFPVGVWSIYFNEDGTKSTQCEFMIPIGGSVVSPVGSSNYVKITALKPIAIDMGSNSTGKLLIGLAFNNGLLPNTYGVGIVDLYNYADDITYSAIESELYEIGTALNPETVNTIEINLAKILQASQTIDVYYRLSIDANWTAVNGNGGTFTGTFTGDGTKNYYKISDNNIGKTQFIQFRVRMATDSNNSKVSPEIRSIKIS